MNQAVKLPVDIDVAIIGGGIIGVSTGYALARAGVRVAVFEKGTLACEQSSRNWGWVRTLGRDMAEVPLALRAHELWRELQQQVDVGFRQTGILYLAENEADEQKHHDWSERAQAIGVNVQLLGRAATLRYLPTTRRPWSGAMFSPTDGVAEPAIATRGIAQLAMAHGCHIVENCAVRGIETSAGHVSGIITEHGHVKASTVLMAGGAWSRLFCGNLDIDLPQLKVRASVLRTSPIANPMNTTINGKDFTCRRRADGGYTVSQFGASYADIVPDSFRLFRHFLPAWLDNHSFVKLRFGKRFFEEMAIPRRFAADRVTTFERMRVLDPAASPAAVSSAFRRLAGAFPDFEKAQILQSWGGYIDVTPDALPVMCAVDSVPGFFLASGFSGHGFGIGPAVGELMAKLIQGRHAVEETRPFELARFHRRPSSWRRQSA